MIPVSTAVANAIEQDSRTFRARFLTSLSPETVLSCNVMRIVQNTGGGGTTPVPGALYSSYITATVQNLETNIKGRDLWLQIGVVTGYENDQEVIGWIQQGVYRVTKTSVAGTRTEFTAVGRLTSHYQGTYTSSGRQSADTLISAIITKIAQATGTTIVTQPSSIPTNRSIAKHMNGMTYAQAISIVAQCLGCFVTEDYQGRVVLSRYGSGSTYSVDLSRFTVRPTFTEDQFTVSGIKCNVHDEYVQDGNFRMNATPITLTVKDTNITTATTVNGTAVTFEDGILPEEAEFNISGNVSVVYNQAASGERIATRTINIPISADFVYGTSSSEQVATFVEGKGDRIDVELYLDYTAPRTVKYRAYIRKLLNNDPETGRTNCNWFDAQTSDIYYKNKIVPAVNYTSGSSVNVTIDNEYMSSAAFSAGTATYVGYSFYPAQIPLALGNPRLEPWDKVRITADSVSRDVPCHQIVATFTGGFHQEISSLMDSGSDDSTEPVGGSMSAQISQTATAAAIAQSNANAAAQSANEAAKSAGNAKVSAEVAAAAAADAINDASRAHVAANEAETHAQEAKESAIQANNHANSALTQLGFVEDVVDTLNWITAHGIYVVTSDTEVEEGKYYFEATQVTNPTGNPREQNYFEYNSSSQKYALSTDTTVTSGKTYYTIAQVTPTDPTGYLELDSVDDAVATYVQSHLALTDEGLYVVKDNQGYKILLANDGMKVYDDTGALVATYGENITFSATRPQTIGGVNSYIKYLQENGQWKIKIVADVIEFTGGESVASTSDVSTAQAAAISTAAADATTKADAAQAAAVSTAAADATTKANDAKKVATNFLTSVSSNNGVQIHAVNNASQNYAQIDANGMNIYKGGDSVAQYGDTVRIGKTNVSTTRVEVSASKMAMYRKLASGDTNIMEIGYDSSIAGNYYTLGLRASGAVGNASTVIGSYCIASGDGATAIGYYTNAGYADQLVIGKWNSNKSNNLFEVGNGNGSAGRSNAFEVTSGGKVTASGDMVVDKDGDYAGIELYVKSSGQSNHYGGYLRMYSQGESTPYGMNGVLETGGGLFIGSGESPANHYSEVGATYKGEDTFITSDGNIRLQCNGNTITDRRGVCIWQSGTNTIVSPCKKDLIINGNNNDSTSGYYYLGADAYRWYGIYAKYIWSNTITVGGHNSPIGTIIDAYLSSNKSLSANTFTMLTSITLPAGTWVCCCGVRFAAGTTGGRVCNLEASSGNGAYNISQMIPTSSAMTNFSFTKIVTSTSSTTLYLNAMSSVATTVNSGGTNYGTFIRAVRIQ